MTVQKVDSSDTARTCSVKCCSRTEQMELDDRDVGRAKMFWTVPQMTQA